MILRRALLISGALLLAAGAGGEVRVQLTAAAPQATGIRPEIRPASSAAAAGTLRLSVVRIENPTATPFGIVARLAADAEIGRVFVYPPDRTGDYMLPLEPDELGRLLGGAAIALALDLPQPPAAALEVEILPVLQR
jgi:hypothetical protein